MRVWNVKYAEDFATFSAPEISLYHPFGFVKLLEAAADIVVLSLAGSDEPDKHLAWRLAAAYGPERMVVSASD